MRILLIITLLIVGCTVANNSTNETYARGAELANESRKISDHEHQCVHEALARSSEQTARIASTPDPAANAGDRMQMIANDRDRELAKCKAAAKREEDELSARERAEYQRQAEQERQQSLMSILTTSQSR
jgi:hypothetical protein